jgi:hypothetical protein
MNKVEEPTLEYFDRCDGRGVVEEYHVVSWDSDRIDCTARLRLSNPKAELKLKTLGVLGVYLMRMNMVTEENLEETTGMKTEDLVMMAAGYLNLDESLRGEEIRMILGITERFLAGDDPGLERLIRPKILRQVKFEYSDPKDLRGVMMIQTRALLNDVPVGQDHIAAKFRSPKDNQYLKRLGAMGAALIRRGQSNEQELLENTGCSLADLQLMEMGILPWGYMLSLAEIDEEMNSIATFLAVRNKNFEKWLKKTRAKTLRGKYQDKRR